MGRHNADAGAGVHPIVAAALEGRLPEPAVVPRHPPEVGAAHEEGPLGWPGEPGDGTGLGWPAETRPTTSGTGPATTEPVTGEPQAPAEDALGGTVPRRRGWRRLFGSAAA